MKLRSEPRNSLATTAIWWEKPQHTAAISLSRADGGCLFDLLLRSVNPRNITRRPRCWIFTQTAIKDRRNAPTGHRLPCQQRYNQSGVKVIVSSSANLRRSGAIAFLKNHSQRHISNVWGASTYHQRMLKQRQPIRVRPISLRSRFTRAGLNQSLQRHAGFSMAA
jgi:hypothetical protein